MELSALKVSISEMWMSLSEEQALTKTFSEGQCRYHQRTASRTWVEYGRWRVLFLRFLPLPNLPPSLKQVNPSLSQKSAGNTFL